MASRPDRGGRAGPLHCRRLLYRGPRHYVDGDPSPGHRRTRHRSHLRAWLTMGTAAALLGSVQTAADPGGHRRPGPAHPTHRPHGFPRSPRRTGAGHCSRPTAVNSCFRWGTGGACRRHGPLRLQTAWTGPQHSGGSDGPLRSPAPSELPGPGNPAYCLGLAEEGRHLWLTPHATWHCPAGVAALKILRGERRTCSGDRTRSGPCGPPPPQDLVSRMVLGTTMAFLGVSGS